MHKIARDHGTEKLKRREKLKKKKKEAEKNLNKPGNSPLVSKSLAHSSPLVEYLQRYLPGPQGVADELL